MRVHLEEVELDNIFHQAGQLYTLRINDNVQYNQMFETTGTRTEN